MKLKIIGILVILFILALGCTQTSFCGNGVCESGEEGNCSSDCPIQLTPNDHIANALLAVKDGGMTTTQTFELNPNHTIKSSQFFQSGFDSHSIVFAVASNLYDTGKFEAEFEDDFSYLVHTGNTSQLTKAIVICEQTGESLEETISISTDEIQEAENADSVQDLCENDAYQPCCIVIIQRD